VPAWSRPDRAGSSTGVLAESQARLMRQQGWTVAVVRPGDQLSEVWKDLARSRLSAFRSLAPQLQDQQQGPAA